MNQFMPQNNSDIVSESSREEVRNNIYEACRPWLETAGDLDDFIFYNSESAVSER